PVACEAAKSPRADMAAGAGITILPYRTLRQPTRYGNPQDSMKARLAWAGYTCRLVSWGVDVLPLEFTLLRLKFSSKTRNISRAYASKRNEENPQSTSTRIFKQR
ncbi:MAG: hypothetical protein RMM08_01665, partial [Armatimonadota bacterium]|nr:hypothetical protein [Armatimonadota bacterium]